MAALPSVVPEPADTPSKDSHAHSVASASADAEPATTVPPDTVAAKGQDIDSSTILTGRKLAVVFTAMLLCLLLIALDQTILATALPHIASDFDAFTQQGWISSAFVLTQTAFLLPFSQFLRIVPAKYSLLGAVATFELGSLVCGVAQNVDTLIVGRALSGVGAAGLFTSMIQIMAQVTRLESRARIVGPLVGGALTDHATWRWCFFINLPIGGVSATAVIFLLKSSPPLGSDPKDQSAKSRLRKVIRMDWLGAVLTLAAITTLVLSFQWGGNTKPWNDGSVIACFVVSAVLFVVLVFWQRYLGHAAMVPTGIFKSFSIYAVVALAFCNRFVMFSLVYYIPIFYQAAKDKTATDSGVEILPLMLGTIITVIISGQIVGKFGRYWPFLLVGGVPMAVGSGLLYTVNEFTATSRIIGFQIIAGIGLGMTLQNSLFAMQAEFKDTPKLLSQGTGMASFGQFFGGTIGLAVAEAAFSSSLAKNVVKYAPTAPLQVIKNSPVAIYRDVPKDLLPAVVEAYVKSIQTVFIIAAPVGGMASIFALFISNIDISQPKVPAAKEKKTDGETEKEAEVALPSPPAPAAENV